MTVGWGRPFDTLVTTARAAAASRPVLAEAERHDLLTLLHTQRRRVREQTAPLGVANQVEAIAMARKAGWLSRPT